MKFLSVSKVIGSYIVDTILAGSSIGCHDRGNTDIKGQATLTTGKFYQWVNYELLQTRPGPSRRFQWRQDENVDAQTWI